MPQNFDRHGTEFDQAHFHDRVVERMAGYLAGRSCQDVYGAFAGIRAGHGFEISSIAVQSAVTEIDGHRGRVEVDPIVPIDQEGALVIVRMSDQHQIDAVAFEDGQGVVAHIRSIGGGGVVGRMVKDRDHPFLGICHQIGFQPVHHRRPGAAIGIVGVHRNDMDIAIVIGKIGFRARCDATGLAGNGERKDVVVHPTLRRAVGRKHFVVARTGIQR